MNAKQELRKKRESKERKKQNVMGKFDTQSDFLNKILFTLGMIWIIYERLSYRLEKVQFNKRNPWYIVESI